MRRIFPATAVCCVVLLVSVSGCTDVTPQSANDKILGAEGSPIQIVATCGMVANIVAVVAGDRAEVTSLMGAGVDPHLYRPDRNDILRLQKADVVFYSGLRLEGRMIDTFKSLKKSGKPVFAVTDAIDRSYLREPPEFAGHYDPHVWMDVSAWRECVPFVAQSLSKLDPAGAASYEQNAAAYQQQLLHLDAYVREAVHSIPKKQRVLVTAHDAFGYFGRAYGMKVLSAQGVSTESEAGVEDVNRLVKTIVRLKLPAIFVETSVSEKNIRAILEGAESLGWQVKIGGNLFSDAMGPSGSYKGTYIGMLDHNATIITLGLGGSIPKKSVNDRLFEDAVQPPASVEDRP